VNPIFAILIVLAILLVTMALTTWGLLAVTDLAEYIAKDVPADSLPPVIENQETRITCCEPSGGLKDPDMDETQLNEACAGAGRRTFPKK
jgi:hypothetical protein